MIDELKLAGLGIALLWCFWSHRSRITQSRKRFQVSKKSNLDEQIRAIEVLKKGLGERKKTGEAPTLTVIDKTAGDGKAGKRVLQDLREEIAALNDLEDKLKSARKSGKHVKVTVRKTSPNDRKTPWVKDDQGHK